MKNRRKELQEMYKQMKPDMGVFIVRNKQNQKVLLEAAQDLKSRMNRIKFQLGAGLHPVRELQQEWNELGEDHFEFEVLENLKYDKDDEAKTDYSEELSILKFIWEERLTGQSVQFYKG